MPSASCSIICQHPGCWMANTDELKRAQRLLLKRPGSNRDSLQLYPETPQLNLPEPDRHPLFLEEVSPNSCNCKTISDTGTDLLPTLKIVNLLDTSESEEDEDIQPVREDIVSTFQTLPIHRKRFSSLLSVTRRPSGSLSKLPYAPCASPSPSFQDHYYKKLEKKAQRQRRRDRFKRESTDSQDSQDSQETNKKVKLSNVRVQIVNENEIHDENSETILPCLIWVPSKRKKKRLKCSKSTESDSSTRRKTVAFKNITGDELGSERYFMDYEKALSSIGCCPSPFTKSCLSRQFPRRLPPLNHDITEKLRFPSSANTARSQVEENEANILLVGDGLLKTDTLDSYERPPPATPQNTRSSLRDKPVHIDPIYKTLPTIESVSNVQESIDKGFMEDETYSVLDEHSTLIIRDGKVLDDSDFKAQDLTPGTTEDSRQVLPLSRVALPRKYLKQMPLFYHCKNSIPCHTLSDIQFQPITGTGVTPSSVSTETLMNTISPGPSNPGKLDEDNEQSNEVEPPLSDEDYNILLETLVIEKRLELEPYSEEIQSYWTPEPLPVPAPTPSSPYKKDKLSKLNEESSVENPSTLSEIKENKETEEKTYKVSDNDESERKTEYETGDPEAHPMTPTVTLPSSSDIYVANKSLMEAADPAPSVVSVASKASSGDWSIDKDFIKQTYDNYRSLSPFKSPKISVTNSVMPPITEANREKNEIKVKEQRISSPRRRISLRKSTQNINDWVGDDIKKQSTKAEPSLRPKTPVSLMPSPSKTLPKPLRQPSADVVPSELSVHHFKPLERPSQSKSPLITPKHSRVLTDSDSSLLVSKISINDPHTKKQKHSPRELYKARIKSREKTEKAGRCKDPPIVIPSPSFDTDDVAGKDDVVGTYNVVDTGDISEEIVAILNSDVKERDIVSSPSGSVAVGDLSNEKLDFAVENEDSVPEDRNSESDNDYPEGHSEIDISLVNEQESLEFSESISPVNEQEQESSEGRKLSAEVASLSDLKANLENAFSNAHANVNETEAPGDSTASSELSERVAPPGSPILDESSVPDFTSGINLNLDLEDELRKAMEGLEDFNLDDNDDDDDVIE